MKTPPSETVCDGNGCRSEANSEGLTKKKLSKKRQQKLDAEIAELEAASSTKAVFSVL